MSRHAVLFLLVAALACAQAPPEKKKPAPPDAPSFVVASAANVAITLVDSWTTSLIRPRWLSVPPSVNRPCQVEGLSPWLYGREPSRARAWGVGIGKIAISETVAYVLWKKHKRWWWVPLALNSAPAVPGVIVNLRDCL
jgi:hypothetical protein